MSPKLPILTILAAIAFHTGPSTVVAQVDPSKGVYDAQSSAKSGSVGEEGVAASEGNELLQRAILSLQGHSSLSAKIRINDVNLFDQSPVGSGAYLEKRSESGLLFRLEVRMQLGGEPSSLLHVCDGRYLWMHRKLGGQESLTRVNARRVEQALEETGNIQELTKVGYWPGFGGLPKLLRALEAAFDFRSLEEAILDRQMPVWVLRGEWKQDQLARLIAEDEGEKKGKSADAGKLGEHVPTHVVVLLGKADSFPRRIEYRRGKPDWRKSGGGSNAQSIITLEFSEVRLNDPIHPARFLYSPGDLEYSDDTKRFLKNLGLSP